MALLIIVLLPFLGAVLPWLAGKHRARTAWAAGAVMAVGLLLLMSLAPRVFAGETLVASWPWFPAAGLNVALRLDGLGFLFALLILGIGLLIVLYARYYLGEGNPLGRFYAFLLFFTGSMLGIVLAENLLLLLVFWELTSLSSFLLIGYWSQRTESRRGARTALAVTGGGGLALLAGILLLGHITGSFELSVVLESAAVIQAHPLYLPTLLLVLLGAFTKSAQFPFHFWLPAAMAAPTPVSAFLHSATMVKAGVFLLARLYPALAGADAWFYLVSGAGLVTFVFAAYAAFFKHDLKGLLAYSTVSHLGLITLLFGFGSATAAVAGVFHIINHATFKASLFMAAGIIDHETGTRDIRRLGGLWRFMPHTALLASVAAAAMAGVPLFNGFLSKEMFFAETLEIERLADWSWVMPLIATLGGVLSVAYAVRFIHDVFFGPVPPDVPHVPHEPPRWMKVPVEVLVALVLLVGVWPALIVGPLLAVAAKATLGGPLPAYSLAVWHGFNLPLLMSAIALTGGLLAYAGRRTVFRAQARLSPGIVAQKVFEGFISGLFGAARRITDAIDNGSLQRYTLLLVGTALVLGIWPFLVSNGLSLRAAPVQPWDATTGAIWLLAAVGALATVAWERSRLIALVAVGVVGLAVSLFFVRFSAPDLALTQISVEVVTVVMLLLALRYLPARGAPEGGGARAVRDGFVAAFAGLGVGALAWGLLTRPFDSISAYHLAQSKPEGGGTNVVNVILVDFRGFDTLGEITVLGIAALGIYLLLDQARAVPSPTDELGRPWAGDRHPVILSLITRALLPLALLVAVYILLRGHNLPGGGFIAGLVTSVALIMQYMASGSAWVQARWPLRYDPIIAVGLALAAATGIGSWFAGVPFLTSTFGHVSWPAVGEFELASAMLFDLGVYFTVIGSTLLILTRLGLLGQMSDPEARAWKS